MNGNEELEKRLRAVLRDRAGEAPSGDGVAERVLAEVAGPPTVLRQRRSWVAWTTPLLAAAAVVAVIATVLSLSHSKNNSAEPAGPSVGATHSAPTSSLRIDSAPQDRSSALPTVAPGPLGTAPVPNIPKWDLVGGGPQLTHFRAVDATFIGTDRAWLLGTADCLTHTVPPPCTAMVRTDNGGATWQSISPPGAFGHIRFANDKVGYAFSATRLDMTTNGTNWTQQPGGALALETLDDNVIRVEQRNPTCVGTCMDVVKTSSVGSSSWTQSTLPAFRASAVQLQRTHGHAFLLVRHGATSSLFASADRGADWQPQADGCAKLGADFAATSIAVGAQGSSLHLLCRNDGGRWGIVSDGRRGTLPPGVQHYPQVQLGAADKNTLFVVSDWLYRSADGGQTWHPVLQYPPHSDLGPPAFEDASTGRWFTDNGRVVWTTTNAGRSWHGVSFSS